MDNLSANVPKRPRQPLTLGRRVQYDAVPRPTQYLESQSLPDTSAAPLEQVTQPPAPAALLPPASDSGSSKVTEPINESAAVNVNDSMSAVPPVAAVEPAATPILPISEPTIPIAMTPAPPMVAAETSTPPEPAAFDDNLSLDPSTIVTSEPSAPFVHPAGQIISPQQAAVTGPIKQRRKLLIVLGLGLLLAIAGGTALAITKSGQKNSGSTNNFATSKPASSYKLAVSQFIIAVQKKDKATADTLQSAAFTSSLKPESSSGSFYDSCQKYSKECSPLFSNLFISPAKIADSDYTAADRTIGKSVSYTSIAASKRSSTTLTLNVIKQGTRWLVDGIDIGGAVSTDGGLSLPAGGISTADQVTIIADVANAQTKLEAYFSKNNSYPGDLLNVGVETLPAGVSYSYNATPAGCTTENKRCSGYALQAASTVDGTVFSAKENLKH